MPTLHVVVSHTKQPGLLNLPHFYSLFICFIASKLINFEITCMSSSADSDCQPNIASSLIHPDNNHVSRSNTIIVWEEYNIASLFCGIHSYSLRIWCDDMYSGVALLGRALSKRHTQYVFVLRNITQTFSLPVWLSPAQLNRRAMDAHVVTLRWDAESRNIQLYGRCVGRHVTWHVTLAEERINKTDG